MRRNISRRGNHQNSAAGGGPLMTGHLQDIEMQLEFLKRKREMIEQEQQLLVMEQQFKSTASRHSYGQMRYDEPDQHGSNRNFTHFNETGPNYGNPFGRKRQADNQWQYDSAPKRISRKKIQNQSQFKQNGPVNIGSGNFRNPRPNQGQGPNQGPGSAPRKPAPLMDIKVPKQSIGQKIANQKAPRKTPNKDFAPSKVSKPKAPAAPNKLASNTVAERKSLVAAATEPSSDGDVSRMLLPDRVPTQQVSGRLELALGAIMKHVKTLVNEHPQHVPALRSIQLQRVMKQAVRERIRTVMLGKVVGSLLEILAIYREEFPEETDADILNIALEAGGVLASHREKKIDFIESEDPGEFFRINMTTLLETRLNEMFSKLHELYGNVSTSDAAAPPEDQIDFIKKGYNKLDENTQEYKDFLNTTLKVNDLRRFLPHLLKKYIPYIIRIINFDESFQNTKAELTVKANEKAAKLSGTNESQEAKGDAITTAFDTPNVNRQMYILPYYVKIMGRPILPKRKLMKIFLSQFNPKSIKKHRTIPNLLFVGFTEKTDFDAVVAADGTVIGRSTLRVRVCSKEGPRETNGEGGENNDCFSNDVSLVEVKKEDQNKDEKDDIIPSELDGQITDLLLSIRKSEEEDTANKENGKKASEETANNDGDENPQSVTEQTENNSKQDETEQEEGVVQDNEEMNAATQENVEENVTQENVEENVTQENVEENVTEGNIGDDNTASQEDEVIDNLGTQNDSETQNMETTDEANTKNSEESNEAGKPTSDDSNKEDNSQKTNGSDAQLNTNSTERAAAKTGEQSDDRLGELKSSGRSTPTRMSARLASVTPSTIRTRRASKLATQN